MELMRKEADCRGQKLVELSEEDQMGSRPRAEWGSAVYGEQTNERDLGHEI